MAAANFERALALVLQHEGGYVDHPADPGGATNLGVTIGTLSGWLGRPATKAEVGALTKATVAPIYRKNYWDAVRGDDLPGGVDYCVFDFAVNSGQGRAIPSLQRAIGVADDGVIGPITLANVASRSSAQIIERICDDRMVFLRRLSTWPTFGKGWTKRVEGVRVEALAMAAAAALVASSRPVPAPAKPIPAPAITSPTQPVPTVKTGGLLAAIAALFKKAF
ncbi:glycoside hydrolase family 108 protein [Methylobacterium oxalidis]|uniref:Uncharacterized protein n=1 Tax=Methylobacterium oxalidis TaxID=944322 RepID=A0A512J6I1_9HYPH|nr:glycoside hydrolase family 108 protein [Methylobacterium oxalidis]GEP05576.1 hypothetical protein MOX02_36140 [Methylobacterium oxalidis]GJE32697.1 hypothetical protein LDDCCGHA_2885 [Methylobacterium oxalidis]GLS65443.1 hypothetical protein GCM10007888_38250 [Methylobacterium oxalidis]